MSDKVIVIESTRLVETLHLTARASSIELALVPAVKAALAKAERLRKRIVSATHETGSTSSEYLFTFEVVDLDASTLRESIRPWGTVL